MVGQPSGTVTFLFTDLEGSTRLWEQHPEAMPEVLARHDAILRGAVAAQDGYVVKTTGDGVFAAFSGADAALRAAIEAQVAMSAEPWGDVGTLRVRMGVHTGAAELRDGDYHGPDVNCAARLMAAAHGGQVVVSLSSKELVRRILPAGAELVDLGEHHLRDLAQPERVFQLVAPGLGREFPALRSLRQTNLPAPVTGLVGRGRELVEIVEPLRRPEVRLVTLTGAGGSGKTRLAIEAAWELVADHDQGVWWVGLAPLRDSALVLELIAQTLGATDEVAHHVGDDHVLLLLDNFEHVLDAGVGVAELVAACPNLKVLVTSREPLHLSAEREYVVPPLTEDEAVALFGERGGPPEPHGVVREICRRLDCLPLAVELAAARTKVLSPEALLDRLESRLPLLTGGPRDAPARQRTLRATIEWSHDLLSPEEQGLFVRLAVFAGWCTLEQAEAIVDADVDGLQSLIDKSLLRRSEDRFWMLETIREFAAECLDQSKDTERLRARHLEWFLALAERAEPELDQGDQPTWMRRLGQDRDNLRTALEWAHHADPRLELRLAGALGRFFVLGGPWSEGSRWLDQALAGATVADAARAKALRYAALLGRLQGDFGQAQSLAREALAMFHAHDDLRGAAATLNILTAVAGYTEGYEAARRLSDKGVQLARTVGDTRGAAFALFNLADVALFIGRPEEARTTSLEALQMLREIDNREGMALSLGVAGLAAMQQHRSQEARRYLHEGLLVADELGFKEPLWWCVDGIAAMARPPDTAARLLGTADRLRDESQGRRYVEALHARTSGSLRSTLGDDRFNQLYAEGRDLPLDQAVAAALASIE